MNLHEIPAFTQNFSIKFACCVPEPVMMLYVRTITKFKKFREKLFSKIHISPCCFSSFSSSSSGCHSLAVTW